MAINFNFLPKPTFYTAFSRHSPLLSFRQRLKKKRECTKERTKVIGSILTVRGGTDINTLLCLFFVINTTPVSYWKKNKPWRDFWTNTVRCDNSVARCPLVADRAYNEVKRGKNIGLIIHGSFVNQWRGIRAVNRLEDLFWLQNGNKGPFTTWMGQLVIKKPALKQREKEFCGSTLLTPGENRCMLMDMLYFTCSRWTRPRKPVLQENVQ